MDQILEDNVKVAFIGDEKFFPLLRAVAEASEVELVFWDTPPKTRLSGILCIKTERDEPKVPAPPANLPSCSIEIVKCGENGREIRFSESLGLFSLLSGRKIISCGPVPVGSSQLEGEVLAWVDGCPIWTTTVQDGVRHDRILQAWPWIAGEDRLFEHLKGRSLMRLLPIMEWFRWLSGWRQWQKPPIRACFMFDDPNLHAVNYGYIHFDDLAKEARRHHYHTAFAIIPIDQFYCSKRAVKIFLENQRELSLLIHGNDHTYRELGGGDEHQTIILY